MTRKWTLWAVGACLLATSVLAQEQNTISVLEGRTAFEQINGTSKLRIKPGTAVPNYLEFASGQEVPFASFQLYMQQFLGRDANFGFELLKTEAGSLGMNHHRYQMTYQGKAIEFATYIVHEKNGLIYSMNGDIPSSLNAAQAQLDEVAAFNHALQYVGAQTYKWELPAEEAHLKQETNDATATYFPKGELVYLPQDAHPLSGSFKAAWKFDIYAQYPISRADVYVDAVTGEELFRNEEIHTADVVGTAVTGYSGQQTITADSFGGGFRLRESGRGNGIETYDMNLGSSYAASVDFTDTDNFWDLANPQLDEYGTDAHWGAEMTYDYLFNIHNRNSIDGNGFNLISYVHADLVGFGLQSNVNAFWDGQRMTYGDGNPPASFPLTAIDITGHEIAHGLTSNTAALIYQNESGALNESFSDIFGAAIEFFAIPANADWLVGEDIGFALRSMSNPKAAGDPDTYQGINWATGTADNGGVHTNSGVQNYWFYLLTEGGTGTNDIGDAYNVPGIGVIDASKVAFRNLTVYLNQSSNYQDARFFAIQSAIDLFGTCSPQLEATHKAWYAVGVGNDYAVGVTADFAGNPPIACQTPANIDFLNLSSNASSYTWLFGDGSNSTQNSPSHVYTNFGTYDVTLIADGGTCGIDTLVLPNYVVVDDNGSCAVVLGQVGTTTTQTSCTGTVYDPGGAVFSYPSSSSSRVTIAPIGAATVTLDFVSFNIEPGNGSLCSFDAIRVYDGSDVNAPLLGAYCNNNMPPASITSTGSSVTIEFTSDAAVNLAGFEVNWQCNLPTVPPNTNFTADATANCSGYVQFTDLTTEGPSSWMWDFGDNTTSTDQNPLHAYQQEGTYEVSLTTTNINGTDAETKAGFVTYNQPDAPMANWADICPNERATLTTSGTGDVRWYTDTLSPHFQTGDTFVTPVLQQSADYWVVNTEENVSVRTGAGNIGIGDGRYFNNPNQHQVFDAFRPMEIVRVRVWSSEDALRIIELRDNNGNVLQQRFVQIGTGIQLVDLNFEVEPGTDYQLGLSGNSDVGLYRNENGPDYPYTVPGLMSITRSSAGTEPLSYYYFFYDWEVRERSCRSDFIRIKANMAICLGVDEPEAAAAINLFPNPTAGAWTLDLTLNQTEQVGIELIGLDGKTIDQLYNQDLPAGKHQLNFDLSGHAQGIYQVRLSTNQGVTNRKLILME